MINNFKKPNLNAPRYREKILGLLNEETIKEFKEKKPLYSNIDNNKLKKIIKLYNAKLWNAAIEYRDGVEFPDSLGYLFIGKLMEIWQKYFIQIGQQSTDLKIEVYGVL